MAQARSQKLPEHLRLETGDRSAADAAYAASFAACPCADKTACEVVTKWPAKELFGFGGGNWAMFDWEQVTTVAWPTIAPGADSILCTAHTHGARLIVGAPHDFANFSSSKAVRAAWIKSLVASIQARHYDGVTFDYESPMDRAPGSATAARALAYVNLVTETTAALKAISPGYQVSVCAAWSPDNIDGRNYDYVALAAGSDLLYMMVYDTRSQIYGRCVASANAPLAIAERGLQRYLQLGIPPEKLVVGTPWYGYKYPCLNTPSSANDVCELKLVPFRGVNCSDAAGGEVAMDEMMVWFDLKNDTSCTPITSELWDDSTMSNYYNCKDATGKVYQLWYDNGKSSQLKYELAMSYGAKGVGPYTWSDIDTTGDITHNKKAVAEAQAMWDALKVVSKYNKKQEL